MSRRKLVLGLVAVVVVGGVVAVVVALTGGSPRSAPSGPAAASTATVVRTDVVETTPVNGTLGFASAHTIVEPAGTASSAITHDQQTVAAAEGNLTADEQAAADSSTIDEQDVATAQHALAAAQATLSADTTGLTNDQATLSADEQKEASDCQGAGAAGGTSGSGGTGACATDALQVAADEHAVASDQQKVTTDQTTVGSDQGQVASAQQKRSQDAHQAQAKVAADEQALANAQAALAADEAAATAYDQTSRFTALPAVGHAVNPGQALWAVNGQAVPLLGGTLTPWRAFAAGMSPGSDVAALDGVLIALGGGNNLTVSDSFTAATAAAIDRLQASLGLPQTGSLPLGSVVFEPTPVRVTAVHAQVGGNVAGGSPVLDVTSTTPVVNVALPVTQTYLVKVGDPVTVTLPDNSTADGTTTAVGTVATAASNSGSSNGNNQPSATVNVTVALSHASAAGSLDQAPVTVNITSKSVQQVLAVPTTALLALAGGGYVVEVVDPDGVHHLVGVTTGLFDDQAGLVQVSGSGLAAGQKVVVAQ
jgi:multidrug efflux pump subunit AcrA (membrane-fusion protein)